jgi:uncharacterized protein
MTIVDSGAVYALYDSTDLHHLSVREAFKRVRGPLVIPTAILAEIDYLLESFLSIDAEIDFLDAVRIGVFTLESFTGADLDRCRELINQYRDLNLGLADAAVVATAERLGVHEILTVDERDFRAVVSKHGRPFSLLPADLPSSEN